MGNPAKLWFMVCNQITARGACPGVGLSTVMKYDNCFRQTRRNYLKILNQVLEIERWAEDVKRSYCMNTEHLFIICWASFVVWSYSSAVVWSYSLAIQLQKATVWVCLFILFSNFFWDVKYSCRWHLKICGSKSCYFQFQSIVTY